VAPGLRAGLRALATLFRPLHTRYAQHWHRRHSGLGPVFANRPDNFEVEAGRFAELVAYIHMNPVRAGLCDRPAASNWTSHRAYLRLDTAPPWLDVARALQLCGFQDTRSDRADFDDFVRACDTRHWQRDPHSHAQPQQLTKIGSPRPGGTRPPDWPTLIGLVSNRCHVATAVERHRRTRCPHLSRARRVTAHIASIQFGISNSEIASMRQINPARESSRFPRFVVTCADGASTNGFRRL
jgi:hypothetical protein